MVYIGVQWCTGVSAVCNGTKWSTVAHRDVQCCQRCAIVHSSGEQWWTVVVSSGVQECILMVVAVVHSGVQWCAEAYSGVQWCAKVYSGARW